MGKSTDVGALLSGLQDAVTREIATTPAVQAREGRFSVATLPITARRWHQIPDMVAVVVDLKSSTKLSTNKWAQSTASLYEASTGNVIRIFKHFRADFVQIQGDGAFALFWGERRYERAMCAAITTQIFGADLVKQLQNRWPNQPKTGLKVGVASGRVLAKRLGIPRNPAMQEPVWAGKPVNYATKAAQCVTSPSIIITASIWKAIAANEYLTQACICSTRTNRHVWAETKIRKLPDGDAQALGHRSTYRWCSKHLDADCQAVLAGFKTRAAAAKAQAKSASSDVTRARAAGRAKATAARTGNPKAKPSLTQKRKSAVSASQKPATATTPKTGARAAARSAQGDPKNSAKTQSARETVKVQPTRRARAKPTKR